MLTVAIQAGGTSRRMGRDKALSPFLGQPLIQHVVNRLSSLAAEIMVTTNQPQAYSFLGLPLYLDLIPGRGALGGIYTALHFASHPFVAVVACDMPFASPALFSVEMDLLISTNADIVIPRTDEGLEPFHAVYRQSTCLPHIKSALSAGYWRVDSWFNQVKVQVIEDAEIRKLDPFLNCFRNVNTPEELAEAEMIAQKNLKQ